jgi:hypothetical protein
MRAMSRAIDRPQCGYLAARRDQERGVDEAILEPTLDRHRLAGRNQIAAVAFTTEIDQRAAGAVGHHELVAVCLGNRAADRDDAVRLKRTDRDRGGRRHRYARARGGDGDGTGGTADDEQAGGGKCQAVAAEIEALVRRDRGMFGHVRRSSHWLTNHCLGARRRRTLNQAVQIPLGSRT